MNTAGTQPSSLYLEMLFLLLAVVLAFVLYFLGRVMITKWFASSQKPAAIFLSRLDLPFVLILVTLCLKISPVQDVLFPSQKITSYLDGALVFFAIFFLIRFVDAMFSSWFVRRGLGWGGGGGGGALAGRLTTPDLISETEISESDL
jgi:hypothetical protein